MTRFYFAFWCILLMNTATVAHAVTDWSQPELQPLRLFFTQEDIAAQSWPSLSYVEKIALPDPYQFLLTQPLMTQGIAQYYQRTPKVRTPLFVLHNTKNNTFYRAVIMIVDSKKNRDDALIADKIGDSTIVELGLIAMNFAALPQAVIDGVLHTQTPFGALLINHKIKTHAINRRYFKINCDLMLARYLQCAQGKTLYGRTNTLVRDDNQQWVAQVVEVLTGTAPV